MSEQETREYLTRIEVMDVYLGEGNTMIDLEIDLEIAAEFAAQLSGNPTRWWEE